MRFEKTLRSPSEKGDVVEALLKKLKNAVVMDDEKEYHIKLVVNELLTNVFCYAQAAEVFFKATLDGGMLTMVIQDNGHGFEYEPRLRKDPSSDPLCENGRGIFIVKLVADQLEYSQNGRKVKVALKLD